MDGLQCAQTLGSFVQRSLLRQTSWYTRHTNKTEGVSSPRGRLFRPKTPGSLLLVSPLCVKQQCWLSAKSLERDRLTKTISDLEKEIADTRTERKLLQSVLGKELDHWTPIERGEFGDHASVRLELSKVKDDLRRKETALSAFRAGAANAQPFPGLPSIPEITSLEAFRAIPGILFKDTPGNETLTLDAFKMSIVRDEQVFADILRFLVQREEQFENRKQFDIRKINPLLCIVGAPGTGKSHVLDYLENKLKSIELTDLSPEKALFYTRVKEMLRDSVFVSITLNSETPFRLREPLEYVLSSRILYTYFVAKDAMDFDSFQQSFRCSLANALAIVREASDKKYAFIAVDELTKVCFDSLNQGVFDRGRLDELVSDATILMDKSKGNRVNFVFSSLANSPLGDIRNSSGRHYKEYALTPLVFVDKLFANMELTDNAKAVIKIAGGHSRTLQNVKTVIDEHPLEDRLPVLLRLLSREHKVSLMSLETAKPVLRSSICGIAVEDKQILMHDGPKSYSAEGLRTFGYCSFLHETGDAKNVIPGLTPYQLIHYFSLMDKAMGERFRDSFRSRKEQFKFGGIDFEKFHSSIECFRRMLWTDKHLGHVKTARIKSLYQTTNTVFSKDFNDSMITLPETYILKEDPSQNFQQYMESGSLLKVLHRDPHEEQKAAILRFHDTNPGFDSVIVSPMHGQRKLHLTFIETRYSRETNGFKETLSEMVRKHGLLVRNVIPLLAAMFDRTAHEGHFKMEFEWHFVYALYRKHQEFTNDLLPPNTIFLNREALTDFYGPSLFGLGML